MIRDEDERVREGVMVGRKKKEGEERMGFGSLERERGGALHVVF